MVKVDKNKCVGCGLCVASCPDNFQIGADGKAEAVKKETGPCAGEAAENCPVGAITVN